MESIQLRYEMGEQIEKGAQGSVISAFDKETRKTVAIKIFDISNAAGLAGFATEHAIHRIMKDKSNHICKVLDSFQIPNVLGFIVMEKYVQDLFDFSFVRNKKLTEKQVKFIFKRLCKGVRDLHRHGVAHLDLKPENILMDAEKVPHICDFGHSYCVDIKNKKYLSKKSRKAIFENLQGRGTRRYSAPEVFGSEEFSPFAADVYSLGIVLHALLTGFYPNDPSSFKLNLQPAQEKLNDNCFALMSSMLREQPALRPSIEDVLNHKWLKSKRSRKAAITLGKKLQFTV